MATGPGEKSGCREWVRHGNFQSFYTTVFIICRKRKGIAKGGGSGGKKVIGGGGNHPKNVCNVIGKR